MNAAIPFLQWASTLPGNHAIIESSGRSITYAELEQRVLLWARTLRDRGLAPGDRVLVRVIDHGIGIAPDDQVKVFQSFYQAAPGFPERRGTGIGLNIARRYAQLQSGHLTLESTLGEGSTFTLDLPAAD